MLYVNYNSIKLEKDLLLDKGRNPKSDTNMTYIYVYTHTHTHIYIYTYIYALYFYSSGSKIYKGNGRN